HRTLLFRLGDCRNHSLDYGSANLVLYLENVGQIAVIPFGPHMPARHGIDELRSNPNAVDRPSDTALNQLSHPKLLRYASRIDGLTLVAEAGIARDDEQQSVPG